jgi:hypothetical protein
MAKIEIELDLGAYLVPIAETLEAFADGSVDEGDLVLLADYLEGVQGNIEIELERLLGDLLDNPMVQIGLISLAKVIRDKA